MTWPIGGRRRHISAPGGRWLITGASRGLGAELAIVARQRFGAAVLSIDRSETSAAASHEHLRIDLSTSVGCDQAVEALRAWRPTVLVNCASTNQSRSVIDTPAAMISEIVGVGFTTPFVLMQEMARLWDASSDIPRLDAWVINIVSPYRLLGVRTHSLYCATKAALSRAGETLGMEVQTDGSLTVVSVVPGAFNSSFRPLEAHDAWLVRTYRTKDGRFLSFSCLQAATYWPAVCTVIDRPELASDQRFAHAAALGGRCRAMLAPSRPRKAATRRGTPKCPISRFSLSRE